MLLKCAKHFSYVCYTYRLLLLTVCFGASRARREMFLSKVFSGQILSSLKGFWE